MPNPYFVSNECSVTCSSTPFMTVHYPDFLSRSYRFLSSPDRIFLFTLIGHIMVRDVAATCFQCAHSSASLFPPVLRRQEAAHSRVVVVNGISCVLAVKTIPRQSSLREYEQSTGIYVLFDATFPTR